MHYIRLLRPPILDRNPPRRSLNLLLTITTDLGDSFLSPQHPILLSVEACSGAENGFCSLPDVIAPGRPLAWQSGMRVLKVNLALPPALDEDVVLLVRPSEERYIAQSTDSIMRDQEGLIVPVYVELPIPGAKSAHVSSRRLTLSNTRPSWNQIEVEEDIGESIARHVWDAGIATVSALDNLLPRAGTQAPRSIPLPWLRGAFSQGRELRILELGSGVGILGIGVASLLTPTANDEGRGSSFVLLTDLPEAEERARANIKRYGASCSVPQKVRIDYENLDWEEGRQGRFGPLVRSQIWDLVVLSDCTYNVDMLPALVQTLSAIHSAASKNHDSSGQKRETRVLLATKPRHPSERALFDLMSSSGWSIQESAVLPLPVLDSEGQSIEIYLFFKD